MNYDDYAAQYNLYDNSIQCSEGADALTISRALVALPPEAATIPALGKATIHSLRLQHTQETLLAMPRKSNLCQTGPYYQQ